MRESPIDQTARPDAHTPLSNRPRYAAQPVYPIFLTHLADCRVVMVGGGAVAARKASGLLAAQAHITVIAPELAPALQAMHTAGQVTWHARRFEPEDVAGARLVFAATDDREVNAAVAEAARRAGALCNVADDPIAGDFHVPAVHRGQGAVLAVGTGGASPRRAVALRDRLANLLSTLLAE